MPPGDATGDGVPGLGCYKGAVGDKASAQPIQALLEVGLSSSPLLLRVNLSSGPHNSE